MKIIQIISLLFTVSSVIMVAYVSFSNYVALKKEARKI
jgi:hypothetical protein